MSSSQEKHDQEIIDLTTDSNQPFVIAKIPWNIYEKILQEMKKSKNNKPKVSKGTWNEEEDRQLLKMVEKYGPKRWTFIAKKLNLGRNGKQCRERYLNHLDPSIKKDSWTEEEDRLVMKYHAKLGNQWSKIAKKLPGRTANSIKNHWNATLNRQIRKNIEYMKLYLAYQQSESTSPTFQFKQVSLKSEDSKKRKCSEEKQFQDEVPFKKIKTEFLPPTIIVKNQNNPLDTRVDEFGPNFFQININTDGSEIDDFDVGIFICSPKNAQKPNVNQTLSLNM